MSIHHDEKWQNSIPWAARLLDLTSMHFGSSEWVKLVVET